MKTYVVKIKPLTGFGTHIKGDSLFGHICWQAYYDSDLFDSSLEQLLQDYEENPFIVVSSAFPVKNNKIYLKRPSMPLHKLFEIPENEIVKRRKELKSRDYFALELPLPPLNKIKYEKINFLIEGQQSRCTINRITGTTGLAPFTPYNVGKFYFDCDLAMFVGLRDDLKIEKLITVLERIGKYGYGKDATVGYGKFEVTAWEEVNLMIKENYNALYTLSPLVPRREEIEDIYFTPFVRFGRHGSFLAKSKNPFKNPVIFADESAIIIPKQKPLKPYIGMAIKDISKTCPQAVTQGYSLILPVEVQEWFII